MEKFVIECKNCGNTDCYVVALSGIATVICQDCGIQEET